MPKPFRISAGEWEIMNLVWDRSPITAAEIVDQVSARRDWSPRTTRTLIDRLVRKGALKFRVDGRRYLYSPAVSRTQCVQKESRSFVDRVFGGTPVPLVMHLVQQTKLSPEEISELKRILDEKEK